MKQLDGVKLYTVEEVSRLLAVTERTLREYLKAGKLKGRKIAGRWHVTEKALHDYVSAPERDAIIHHPFSDAGQWRYSLNFDPAFRKLSITAQMLYYMAWSPLICTVNNPYIVIPSIKTVEALAVRISEGQGIPYEECLRDLRELETNGFLQFTFVKEHDALGIIYLRPEDFGFSPMKQANKD